MHNACHTHCHGRGVPCKTTLDIKICNTFLCKCAEVESSMHIMYKPTFRCITCVIQMFLSTKLSKYGVQKAQNSQSFFTHISFIRVHDRAHSIRWGLLIQCLHGTHISQFYPLVMVIGKISTEVKGHLTRINVTF